MLGVLLGVVVSLLTVNPVHALGLGELVNLAADDTGKELLGESVAHRLAYGTNTRLEIVSKWEVVKQTVLALVVLVGLHGTEGSGTGSELVGELALVVLLTVVDITVSLLGFVWWEVSMN